MESSGLAGEGLLMTRKPFIALLLALPPLAGPQDLDNGKPNLTVENDNLSKIKARYMSTDAQPSKTR
jgi:hypothetical protein